MRFVEVTRAGGPEVLRVAEGADPVAGPGEVLVAVEAAGASHADSLQRRGLYPPPPGQSPILGLEAAGTIVALGEGVEQWKTGDRICALCNGGGYAELVAVPAGQVLPIPGNWSAIEAATLPENAFTVYDNLVTRARLQSGETVLLHGGSGGIGSMALGVVRALGARAIATAGSPEKCDACIRLGAFAAINYKATDFVAEVLSITEGSGVDVVLDVVGGDYIARDLQALAKDGRIVCIGSERGRLAELDLAALFAKRAGVMGSSLRPRTSAEKAAIARRLREHLWPLLPARDPIAPVVDSIYTFEDAAIAHARLDSSAHVGNIVLVPGDPGRV